MSTITFKKRRKEARNAIIIVKKGEVYERRNFAQKGDDRMKRTAIVLTTCLLVALALVACSNENNAKEEARETIVEEVAKPFEFVLKDEKTAYPYGERPDIEATLHYIGEEPSTIEFGESWVTFETRNVTEDVTYDTPVTLPLQTATLQPGDTLERTYEFFGEGEGIDEDGHFLPGTYEVTAHISFGVVPEATPDAEAIERAEAAAPSEQPSEPAPIPFTRTLKTTFTVYDE